MDRDASRPSLSSQTHDKYIPGCYTNKTVRDLRITQVVRLWVIVSQMVRHKAGDVSTSWRCTTAAVAPTSVPNVNVLRICSWTCDGTFSSPHPLYSIHLTGFHSLALRSPLSLDGPRSVYLRLIPRLPRRRGRDRTSLGLFGHSLHFLG